MNSIWLMIGALAAVAVAYRYYSAFLAAKVALLENSRLTPAHRMRDGVDYHPTNRWVLFGHHFAAIAGPGPLVGPVLAAQWGYFPGYVWIVVGACLAGAVHDFVVLWASVRQDGLSLPRLARSNIGRLAGVTTSIATLFIVVVTLASVATVVVNSLSHSSWGMFTILATIPAALITGLWMYRIRPGHIVEASAVGVIIVFLGVFWGKPFAESAWGSSLIFNKEALSIILPVYAAIASILPVWVLMCPRDYLSSYMKVGVIAILIVGILIAHPQLKMPAVTPFLGGGGPIINGPVWPFLMIVVMCGAISGFHSLVASGTTPKMVNRESDVRMLGYGAMMVEAIVAVTALVAACALEPGDYFAINSEKARYAQVAPHVMAERGWDISPRELRTLEEGVREKLEARPGGAVTLAVGMAKVFSSLPGMKTLISYWYHFVIMFEALFILTLLETGTRVARFVFQETAAELFRKGPLDASSVALDEPDAAGTCNEAPLKTKGKINWRINIGMSVFVCFLWGYLLYRGDLETLWRILGIANQLLASTALAIGTTYILLRAPKRIYALCTAIPFFFLVITTFWGSILSLQGWLGEIGKLKIRLSAQLLAATEMSQAVKQLFMWRLVCSLTVIMLALVFIIVADSLRRWREILSSPRGVATDAAPGN